MRKIYLALSFIIVFTAVSTAQQVNTYPVVISFNSMCCGVPDNAPVIKLINNFKKLNRVKRMAVDSIGPMGKEGEYYLAFRLKELNKAQQQKFIKQLKKLAPTMTDKGSAAVEEQMVVDKSTLSSRASITTLKF